MEACCKNFLQQQQQRQRQQEQEQQQPLAPGRMTAQAWSNISSFLEQTRSPLQCQIRWSQLRRKDPGCSWSEDEENALIILIGRHVGGKVGGVDWKDVQQKLGSQGSNKTADQCRCVAVVRWESI